MASSAASRRVEFDQHEADVYSEMDRMWTLGYSLVPLDGDEGKSAIMKFGDRKRLPLKVVWDRMWQAKTLMYGIRLDKLVLVDLDTATPEAEGYMRRRFGQASVEVLTRRGRHLWFRIATTSVPPSVDENGIRIDIKSGPNEYAVGPRSVRPDDGFVYQYDGDGFDRRPMLIPFTDRLPVRLKTSIPGEKVAKGKRHEFMLKKAAEYAWTSTTERELYDELIAHRAWELEDPESFPDAQVARLASWAWKLRLSNELNAGRESNVKLRRSAYDDVLNREHGCEAWGLYTVLVGAHGHIPGKTFAIVPEAMRDAGLLRLSDPKIRRARDILIDAGLLVQTRRRPGFSMPNQYQLARPGAHQGLQGEGGGSILLH